MRSPHIITDLKLCFRKEITRILGTLVEKTLLVQLFQLKRLEKKKENGTNQKIERAQEQCRRRRNTGRIKLNRRLRLIHRDEI